MKLRGMGGHMTHAILHEINFARKQFRDGIIRAEQFAAIERRCKARLDERADVFGGRLRMVRKAIREVSMAA